MVDEEILAYYGHGLEQNRLADGQQRIEFFRVWDLLERHLPPPPARILDVGGVLSVLRMLESEPSIIGMSQNLIAVAQLAGGALRGAGHGGRALGTARSSA
ncbi:MAG: Methylase involved in ubiquinone/menaquinone biosynthesis-like protein [Gemmatimonadales bacterium]|nr:Methylase involved in ubiquinone/menaquinone biosynthesis-like protein [Gemmatimonadales bacterium]